MSESPFINRSRKRPYFIPLILLTFLLMVPLFWLTSAAEPHTLYFPVVYKALPPTPVPTGPLYGVNFISAPERLATEAQYQQGLSTGATWNRWPLYWFNVERSPGLFCWNPGIPGCDGSLDTDAAVIGDIAHGLKSNAIFLGTPGFYYTGQATLEELSQVNRRGGFALEAVNAATPQGLYLPVFTDGSDVPGPGKQINPENRWARFVHAGVTRYRPGGTLAQERGWPQGVGVTHWEMWNEPDLHIFWDGSLPDFARLQKVGYLAAKQADPNAQVIFGALANNYALINYYNEVLAIYDDDPLAPQFHYYHDILATHSYFHSWKSWYHVWRAGRSLSVRGLAKPIWLNESGVTAWNDYPGPVWDANSPLRANMEEQAAYIIQSAMYAMFAGADAIFHFQLFDGCGNQPAYTNFPPHNGELCRPDGMLVTDPTKPCAGDANGLFRNPNNDPSFTCFTQHPSPGTPRANLAAFQVLTTYVQDVHPLTRQRQGTPKCIMEGTLVLQPPIEIMVFRQPDTGKRVVGMWTLCGDNETAVIPATNPAGTALLVAMNGSTQTITAQNGVYTIQLPAATNRNPFPGDGGPPPFYPIGGRPYVLVEPMGN